MGDLAWLDEDVIRVSHSYDGPLKEDKAGGGKGKFVPAPDDLDAMLGPHVRARLAAGAKPEDLLFPCANRSGGHYRKEFIESCWERVAEKRKLTLTWYEATRHSFVSRNLSRDATLDEVSAAVGHSNPGVTQRFYNHFIRRRFSEQLRAGVGLVEGGGGEVIALRPEGAKVAEAS